ncbi:putative membrane protein [Lachnospiraceae bacterium PF1-22]|uniref:LiaF domain-containing protein n=1 Tax=Ohessyouella blattaphilus TaxID=2949333 RepID=UPI003E2312BB
MRKQSDRIFWGGIFIIAAIVVVLGRMEIFDFFNFSLFRNGFLSILLLAVLIKCIISRSITGAVFSGAFLVIINRNLLWFIGLENLSMWTILFAATLVCIGLNIIFPEKFNKQIHDQVHNEMPYGHASNVNVGGETSGSAGMGADMDETNFSTVFGSSVKYITANDFRGSNLEAVFGTLKVYFDQAVIQTGEPIIKVSAIFGTITVFVPKEWHVISETSAVFASVTERGMRSPDSSKVVRLRGETVFGKVEIVYI